MIVTVYNYYLVDKNYNIKNGVLCKMENAKVILTEDQKAVVERELKSAFDSMAMLLQWIKDGSLREDMKETLPNLIDGFMKTVKETIGFTGEESEREKEMNESIGQYFQKQIKDLEVALESQNSISSISANVEHAFRKIDKWWDIEGFEYIRKKQITGGGIMKFELGFSLDSFTSNYSKTPVTDKESLKTKIQYLMDEGFEFTPKKRGYRLEVIDNDNNRKILIKMIKDAFPSAKIWKFNNHLRLMRDEQESFLIIRGVEVTIPELNDVENLEIGEKYFLINEDDWC